MAKSPFYKVLVESTKEDLTEMIGSIDYEDVIKGDDLVVFQLRGLPIEKVDEPFMDVGTNWAFYYGFIQGKQSLNRKCVITETAIHYNKGRINATVTARDLGYTTKRLSGSYVFKGKTASEIAEEIADAFGFQKDIETTSTVYDIIPMANKNFMQVLKELALKEGSEKSESKGSIEVYVRGDKLTFKRRDLSVESIRLFEYGDGDGPVKEVDITYEDVGTTATKSIQTSGVDIETGEPYNSKVFETDESSTGPKKMLYDVEGNLEKKLTKEDANAKAEIIGNSLITASNTLGIGGIGVALAGATMLIPAENKEEAEKKITKKHKDSNIGAMKLVLTLELDPTLEAGEIITLNGVAQKHVGNWRLIKVNHQINGGGGITIAEGDRNGAKKSSTINNENTNGKVNDTIGNNEGNTEKDLFFVSQTGEKFQIPQKLPN